MTIPRSGRNGKGKSRVSIGKVLGIPEESKSLLPTSEVGRKGRAKLRDVPKADISQPWGKKTKITFCFPVTEGKIAPGKRRRFMRNSIKCGRVVCATPGEGMTETVSGMADSRVRVGIRTGFEEGGRIQHLLQLPWGSGKGREGGE